MWDFYPASSNFALNLTSEMTYLPPIKTQDKIVRLWDLESKSCLKLFAYNDYGKMPN